MYAALIREFSSDCCRRIAAGEALSPVEYTAFRTLLEARELHGTRMLGDRAGEDECLDTVSGRCGVSPLVQDLATP